MTKRNIKQTHLLATTSRQRSPQAWSVIGFLKTSISLLKKHPKLLLLGITVLVLSGAGMPGMSNFRLNNFLNRDDLPPVLETEEGEKTNTDEKSLGKLEKYQALQPESDNIIQTDDKQPHPQTDSLPDQVNQDKQPLIMDFSGFDNLDELEETTIFTSNSNLFPAELENNLAIKDDALLALLQTVGLELDQDEDNNLLPNLLNQVNLVLNHLITAFKRTPSWVPVTFGLQLVVFFLFSLIFALAVSAWSQAAMMLGIKQAELAQDQSWSLGPVAKKALRKIKPMIWINIIPYLKVILWAFGWILAMTIALGGLGSFIRHSSITSFALFAIFLAVSCFFLLKIVRILFGQLLGQRYLVFNEVSGNDAFTRGVKLATTKGNTWKLIKLGLFHQVLFGVVTPALMALPLLISLFVYITNHLPQASQASEVFEAAKIFVMGLSTGWIWLILTLGIITLLGFVFIKIVIVVLTYTNWHWAYHVLLEQPTKKDNISAS